MLNREKLGNRIRDLVYHSDKTYREIADAIGITDGAVAQWMSGMALPGTGTILKVAKYFGTTADALLDGCVE